MKQLTFAVALAAVFAIGTMQSAEAGCITGAVVGGVAGHMVGHGGVGAAAGCAVGHHRAVTRARANQTPSNSNGQPGDPPTH